MRSNPGTQTGSPDPDGRYGPDEEVLAILRDALAYSRERDYTGYDYFDGMSSKLLRALPVENKWLNIAVQEGIKRAPVNVRPLFLVEQRRNYKGTALFLLSNLYAYRLTGEERYGEEVRPLAEWLVANQSEGFEGFCGGHRHAMQQLREKREAGVPNVVPTSYAVKALLKASEFEPAYRDHAREAVAFLEEELDYREVPGGAKIKYHPFESGEYYTLNGGAIGARTFLDLYAHIGDEELLERAEKLLDYVGAKQTELGGWYYRDPASASHLSMDNHHNGFIVESFHRYSEVGDSNRYGDTLETAVDFYRSTLFDSDGSPNWDEQTAYPKDVHAAAQGIVLFSLLGDDEFARRIIDWTIDELYAGGGRFYYQKRRFYTKKFTLMRWCQAWMAYALSVYLTGKHAPEAHGGPPR